MMSSASTRRRPRSLRVLLSTLAGILAFYLAPTTTAFPTVCISGGPALDNSSLVTGSLRDKYEIQVDDNVEELWGKSYTLRITAPSPDLYFSGYAVVLGETSLGEQAGLLTVVDAGTAQNQAETCPSNAQSLTNATTAPQPTLLAIVTLLEALPATERARLDITLLVQDTLNSSLYQYYYSDFYFEPAPIQQNITLSFKVSNLNAITDPDAIRTSGIEASWPTFAQESAANTTQQQDGLFNVTFLPGSSMVDSIQQVDCEPTDHADAVCHNVTASYSLLINRDEIVEDVKQLYSTSSRIAIQNGHYQAVLDRLGSDLVRIGSIAPDPTGAPTGAPSAAPSDLLLPVLEVVGGTAEHLRWAQVLLQTNASLPSGGQEYTLFAPTDGGINGWGGLQKLLQNQEWKHHLEDLVLYHVLPGARWTIAELETSPGSYATAASFDETMEVAAVNAVITINREASVTRELEAANGMVQILDRVLQPQSVTDSIFDFVGTESMGSIEWEFSTLTSLLTKVALDQVLSAEGPFTLWAPTDNAFAAMDRGELNYMMDDTNQALLLDVLNFHVAQGIHTAEDFRGDGPFDITMENGKNTTVSFDGSSLFTTNGANVIVKDVLLNNGVMHVIDTVLVPEVQRASPTLLGCTEPDSTTGCGRDYKPVVCGELNCTYANRCLANAAGFDACSPLPCTMPDPAFVCRADFNPVVCGELNCTYDNECLANSVGFDADACTPAPCAVPDAAVVCRGDFNPVVCGELNCTYDNECLANAAGYDSCTPDVTPAPTSSPTGTPAATIWESIGSASQLQRFKSGLEEVNVNLLLSNGDIMFTVFAPSDEAVENTAFEFYQTNVNTWNGHLTNLLENHIVAGSSNSLGELFASANSQVSIAGETIPVNATDRRVGGHEVTQGDLLANNGVLHIVDGLLLNSAHTFSLVQLLEKGIDAAAIQRRLQATDTFAQLLELLRSTGLINDVALTERSEEGATLVAPMAISDEIQASERDSKDELMLYHVLETNLYTQDLGVNTPYLLSTRHPFAQMFVTVNEAGEMRFNDMLSKQEILGKNGVIHAVDGALKPPTVVDFVHVTNMHANLSVSIIDSYLQASGWAANEDMFGGNGADGRITLLAPIDDAWAAVSSEIQSRLMLPLWSLHLQDLLKNLLLPEAYSQEELRDAEKSLAGTSVIVGSLLDPSMQATNGIIHLVNNFDLPPSMMNSVFDLIANNDTMSDLLALIGTSGLTDALKAESPAVTFFAPPSGAVADAPLGFLENHIFLELLYAEQLLEMDGQVIRSMNDKGWVVEILGESVFLRPERDDADMPPVEVQAPLNMLARNGVLHGIDGLLVDEKPSEAPSVQPSLVPSAAPSFEETIVTIETEFLIYNLLGLTSNDVGLAANAVVINEAFGLFAEELVRDVEGQLVRRHLGSVLHSRQLAAALEPNSPALYGVRGLVCPVNEQPPIPDGAQCQIVYGKFQLAVTNEDAAAVEERYLIETEKALEEGKLQESLDTVDPSSPFVVQGAAPPETHAPSALPSIMPSIHPSLAPSKSPSTIPSLQPSVPPSIYPSFNPSLYPSFTPSILPSVATTSGPSAMPSFTRTNTLAPTASAPTATPSANATTGATQVPTLSATSTAGPSTSFTSSPTISSSALTNEPTLAGLPNATNAPSLNETASPTLAPIVTSAPTTALPTPEPSTKPPLRPIPPTARPTLGNETGTSPTAAPIVTATPSPSGTPELVRVNATFLMYNSKGLTSEDVSDPQNVVTLNRAFIDFVTRLVADVEGNNTNVNLPARNLRASWRARRLEVELTPRSTAVYGVQDVVCPKNYQPPIPDNATCQNVIGKYNLTVTDEDPDAVYERYVNETEKALAEGKMNDSLERVDPDFPFIVFGPAGTDDSTPTEPTEPPVEEKDDKMEWWAIMLIVLCCLLGVCCIGFALGYYNSRPKQTATDVASEAKAIDEDDGGTERPYDLPNTVIADLSHSDKDTESGDEEAEQFLDEDEDHFSDEGDGVIESVALTKEDETTRASPDQQSTVVNVEADHVDSDGDSDEEWADEEEIEESEEEGRPPLSTAYSMPVTVVHDSIVVEDASTDCEKASSSGDDRDSENDLTAKVQESLMPDYEGVEFSTEHDDDEDSFDSTTAEEQTFSYIPAAVSRSAPPDDVEDPPVIPRYGDAPSRSPGVAPAGKDPSVCPRGDDPSVAPSITSIAYVNWQDPSVGPFGDDPSVVSSLGPTVAPLRDPSLGPGEDPSVTPPALPRAAPLLDPSPCQGDDPSVAAPPPEYQNMLGGLHHSDTVLEDPEEGHHDEEKGNGDGNSDDDDVVWQDENDSLKEEDMQTSDLAPSSVDPATEDNNYSTEENDQASIFWPPKNVMESIATVCDEGMNRSSRETDSVVSSLSNPDPPSSPRGSSLGQALYHIDCMDDGSQASAGEFNPRNRRRSQDPTGSICSRPRRQSQDPTGSICSDFWKHNEDNDEADIDWEDEEDSIGTRSQKDSTGDGTEPEPEPEPEPITQVWDDEDELNTSRGNGTEPEPEPTPQVWEDEDELNTPSDNDTPYAEADPVTEGWEDEDQVETPSNHEAPSALDETEPEPELARSLASASCASASVSSTGWEDEDDDTDDEGQGIPSRSFRSSAITASAAELERLRAVLARSDDEGSFEGETWCDEVSDDDESMGVDYIGASHNADQEGKSWMLEDKSFSSIARRRQEP